MYTKKIFASIFLPSAAIITESKKSDKEEDDSFKCRPSELPIYTNETKRNVLLQETQQADIKPNFLEESICKIRLQIVSAYDQVKYYKDVTEDYISDGVSNAQWMVDYLGQDSAAPTHKAGAIAVGGLAGFILGLRGGFFRRTLFTSVGALGMASICYPKEAAEYSNVALEEAHNYATIGYNFIYGVKVDDPPLELPKMPTNITEVWDMITGTTKGESVSDKEAMKVDEKVNDDGNNNIQSDVNPQFRARSYLESQLDLSDSQCSNKRNPNNENPDTCGTEQDVCHIP